jgi:4-hydroxybenzoate polyprenyltransferase
VVFLPAIASHTIFDSSVFGNATLAFFSFGFATSAGCILDDLLDLEEDRRHTKKKKRPFASGRMFIGSGIALAIAALLASAALASLLPRAFATALIAFFVLTSLYSLFFERFLVVSLSAVALLYTLRVVAGSLATGAILPPWLLVVAFFLFLGLALAKRAADSAQHRHDTPKP